MAIELNLSECIPKFITEPHCEYPERMQYLNATLTHPSLGELATARCVQIHGRIQFKNAGNFLEMMDDESQELHEFSVSLFDKCSNVRPWLVDGGPKSGSGCWGTELSIGDMLYIKEVDVKKEVCSFDSLFSLILMTLTSSLEDVVLAHISSTNYWIHLIWGIKVTHFAGQPQLILRIKPSGCINRLRLLLSIVK